MIVALVVGAYPPSGMPPVGGVEVATVRLARELRRQGVDATVVAPGKDGNSEFASGAPVLRLDVNERWSAVHDLRSLRRALTRALDDLHPVVVHAQGLVPAGYAIARTALPGRPTIVTAHGNRRRDTLAAHPGPGGRARWLLGRRMARVATKRADVVVAVHPDWRLSLPVEPARFEFIPNIVEDRFFSAIRRPDGLRVLYCGGLRAIKGLDLLLDAWPLVLREQPQARLLAPGCSAALGALPPDVTTTVDAPDWLDSAALAGAMESASLVVFPSRFEVAPIAMSEAWAARVPVVAAAVGGIPQLAQRAATLVFEAGPSALSDAIVSVLAGNESSEEMVREGYRRAQSQRAEPVATAHRRLYELLIAG